MYYVAVRWFDDLITVDATEVRIEDNQCKFIDGSSSDEQLVAMIPEEGVHFIGREDRFEFM